MTRFLIHAIAALNLAAGDYILRHRHHTIAVFGDSIGASIRVDREHSFTIQLENKLRADGYNAHVINDSYPGDTTVMAQFRIDSVLEQHPDVVILELGVNDIQQPRLVPGARSRLIGIIHRFESAGIKVIVAGVWTPLFDARPIYAGLDWFSGSSGGSVL